MSQPEKTTIGGESETVERCFTNDDLSAAPNTKGDLPVMRSEVDNLSVWESLRRYKIVSLVAMCAAFSASLDGYRKPQTANSASYYVD